MARDQGLGERPPLPPDTDANEWEYVLEGDVNALDLEKEEERNAKADRPAQG
jgi:hypothetical protein